MPAIYVFSKQVLKRARKDKSWLYGQKTESPPGWGTKRMRLEVLGCLPPHLSAEPLPLVMPFVFKKNFYSIEVTKTVCCWLSSNALVLSVCPQNGTLRKAMIRINLQRACERRRKITQDTRSMEVSLPWFLFYTCLFTQRHVSWTILC